MKSSLATANNSASKNVGAPRIIYNLNKQSVASVKSIPINVPESKDVKSVIVKPSISDTNNFMNKTLKVPD
jgi:hypothetical protein